MLSLHLLTFTIVALLCHGELARSRPSVAHLTEFYLWISLGGMLGGLLNSIVAPLVFTSTAEYPLLLVAACVAMARYEDFVRVLRQPRLLIRPAAAAAIAWAALIVGDALTLEPREIFPFLGIAAVLCFSVSRDPARFAFGVALLMTVGALAHGPRVGTRAGGGPHLLRHLSGVGGPAARTGHAVPRHHRPWQTGARRERSRAADLLSPSKPDRSRLCDRKQSARRSP